MVSWCVFSATFLIFSEVRASKILVISPHPTFSHQQQFQGLHLALASKGHEVTIITTHPIQDSPTNSKQIDISSTIKDIQKVRSLEKLLQSSNLGLIDCYKTVPNEICRIQLASPQIQNLIKSNETFDAVVLEVLAYTCYYGLVHAVGSPVLVGLSTVANPSPIMAAMGSIVNPAHVPEFMMAYTDHMNFWQRLYNVIAGIKFFYVWHNWVLRPSDITIKKYVGEGLPIAQETDANFSLMIVNHHVSMSFPRPYGPDIIDTKQLHVRKIIQPLPQDIHSFLENSSDHGAIYFSLGSQIRSSNLSVHLVRVFLEAFTPLPQDIHSFLENSSDHGAIYFSLGSQIRSSNLSVHLVRVFLEAFTEIPQKVLWKWETDTLQGKPDNVMLAKWAPQQDILAHKNVRAFITQGGSQSLQEATYQSVPVVVIPFMTDQYQNAAKMDDVGSGVHLAIWNITKDSVLWALKSVVNDRRFQKNMQRHSAIFRDDLLPSLDHAVWWIEYVIRHRGAPHLRNASRDIPWLIQFYSLDLLLVILAICVVVYTIITKYILRFCLPVDCISSK